MIKPVIACIAKNEDKYIEEWMLYHFKLGFEHIYLYTNDWDYTTQNPNVTVIPMSGSCMQLVAYNQFLTSDFDYTHAAVVDVDEYICLKKHNNISDFLVDHPYDVIAMSWVMFGDGGQTLSDDFSLVNRFTWREKAVNEHIKIIIKKGVDTMPSPHHAFCASTDTNGKTFHGPFNPEPVDDVIQLNHYFVKTYDEFVVKVNKGRVDVTFKREMKEFEEANKNEVQDFIAMEFFKTN